MTTNAKKTANRGKVVQGGPSWGVILGDSTSPRHSTSVVREEPGPCHHPHCRVVTRLPEMPDGRRLCKIHKRLRPKADRPRVRVKREYAGESKVLAKGRVWRLCVGCDGKLQKGPGESGPFLCTHCRRLHYQRGVSMAGEDECYAVHPVQDLRVAWLEAMYEAVDKAGGEDAARAAGLPTMKEQLPPPEFPDRDPITSEDDGGEDDDA